MAPRGVGSATAVIAHWKMYWKAGRRLAVLLASAGMLAACCTPVAEPGTVQAGSGSCGAYIVPSNSPAGHS